ncbi:hypothetical protein MSG28_016158 [Choristoneura fumiferana]|uniref:Uncharacterized protein n=1 Tax=Choristoneura fumiferana TaxID=7141 RepID=A0ACC0K6M1_CHOFU|nr:hypothetical protein MSG28_016158 [Choristoneura fumiferana]
MCSVEQNPIFRDLSAEDPDPEVTEVESLCMNCHANGMTRLLLTRIPYYKNVVLMSFSCEECGYQNNEIQPARAVAGLTQDQASRRAEHPAAAEQIDAFVRRLQGARQLDKRWTLELEDASDAPASNPSLLTPSDPSHNTYEQLVADEVYTINSESNHLLIFGVPALNLRQEAKALFHKFGKLKLFTITKEHKAEQFTETYHTVFDRIQSARMAKKMLDTKNFYGGSLHVTYAPELESLEETRVKLAQRKYDVLARLKNLQKEEVPVVEKVELVEDEKVAPKLNMGEENIIQANGLVRKRKYKHEGEKFKPCFISNEDNQESDSQKKTTKIVENVPGNIQNMVEKENSNVEIVDCTSVNVETITNINEHLNVDRFDNIRIYKVPEKPVNKIKFNVRFSFYLLNIFNGMAVIRNCN